MNLIRTTSFLLVLSLVHGYDDEGECDISKMDYFDCDLTTKDNRHADGKCSSNRFYIYYDDCNRKCHRGCSDHPQRDSRCEDDLSDCITTRSEQCDEICGRGEFEVTHVCFTDSVPEVMICPTFCCCRRCLPLPEIPGELAPGILGSRFPPYKTCSDIALNPHHDIACQDEAPCCPDGMTAYSDIPGFCFSQPSGVGANFDDATTQCNSITHGSSPLYAGYMIELTTEARHQLVSDLGIHLWFGAKREAPETDLIWQHSGGSAEADVASRWGGNSPGDDCLNGHKHWRDGVQSPMEYADNDCDKVRQFICEIEALC